jgi:hypothetical protein
LVFEVGLVDEITSSSHRKTMAPDREAGRVSPVAGNGAARANASLAAVSNAGLPDGEMLWEITEPEGEITIW